MGTHKGSAMRWWLRTLAFLGPLMAGAAQAASGELVAGTFPLSLQRVPMAEAVSGGEGDGLPFVVDFTPRASAVLFLARTVGAGGDGGTPYGGEGRPDAVRPSANGFVVGGALRFSGIDVGGSYARTRLFAADTELVSAGFRYGRFSAAFGYAFRQALVPDVGELWLLRTDLSALPWLSLESDLWLGRDEAREPVAVGRIGVRLRF